MTFKKTFFLLLLIAAFAIGTFLGPFHKENKHIRKSNNSHTTKILVSIKPLYSLVLGLTKNVPKMQTELLLYPPHSPHTFHLKPSDVNKIVEADLIVWVGPELENFLINPLANLKNKNQLLTLLDIAPIKRLNIREGANWEPHEHEGDEHDHDHDHEHNHSHHSFDPHIWLNTHNAREMVLALSTALQKRDPMNRAIYIKNTQNLLKKLDNLHSEIKTNLKDTHNKPFLVFHDAYQYFEKEFGLHATGSITLNPQVPLSAKRLKTLQASIKDNHIQCVFSEPEFSQTLVQKLLYKTDIKNFELDPLGARITMQPKHEDEFYMDLMRGIGNSFKACLISS